MSEIDIKVGKIVNNILLSAKSFVIKEMEDNINNIKDNDIKIKLMEKMADVLNSELIMQTYSHNSCNEKEKIHVKGTPLTIEKVSSDHFQRFIIELNKLYDFTKLSNYPKTVIVYEAIKRMHQNNEITQQKIDELILQTRY